MSCYIVMYYHSVLLCSSSNHRFHQNLFCYRQIVYSYLSMLQAELDIAQCLKYWPLFHPFAGRSIHMVMETMFCRRLFVCNSRLSSIDHDYQGVLGMQFVTSGTYIMISSFSNLSAHGSCHDGIKN